MGHYITRRLLAIPVILFAVNLIGFAYGYTMLYRVTKDGLLYALGEDSQEN
jgi:hypothetical protein